MRAINLDDNSAIEYALVSKFLDIQYDHQTLDIDINLIG